jgi:hypothetical protein
MEEKHKTSMNLNKQLWKEWIQFVVAKTGSTMTISKETEQAIREYMRKHPLDKKTGSD